MATISEKELALVQKFRRRVTDVVPSAKLSNDYWLIRWLRARELDLEKAEAMLRKSMGWARRNELDTLLEWSPIHNYFRFATLGPDRDGSPVFILPMGLWDMRELVEIGDLIPGVRAAIKLLAVLEDEIEKCSKKLNRPVNQCQVIFDCQQFAYRQLNNRTVVQGAVEFFRIFEANYPEIMKRCFFINTPRIFPVFFAILRPFVSTNTYNKMEFFGSNQTKWTRALLSQIPAEILPPYYGGTLRGTDEYCSSESIWNDEPLPANYFGTDMSKGRNSICQMNDIGPALRRCSVANGKRQSIFDAWTGEMKKSEIPAGSKVELEFPLSKVQLQQDSNWLLRWRIKSEGYDIGFEVSFKDDWGSSEEMINNRRIESHVVPQEGSLLCDRAGTYMVTLDNTFSKRRKKLVLHSIVMEEMDEINNR